MCQPTVSSVRLPATGRPRWGLLYVLVAPQLAALAIVELSGPPNVARATLRYALALGVFAAMAAWIRSNRAAIELQDWCDCASRTMTVRVIEHRPPAPPAPPRLERIPAPADVEHELAFTEP